MNKIPSRTPVCTVGRHPYDAVHDQLAEARRLLCGLGLDEAQGQTLLPDAIEKFNFCEVPVRLANPLSSEMTLLRPSLLPGLLDSLQRNLNRKSPDLALFEIGRVFETVNGAPREERRVAIMLTGQRQPTFWSGNDRGAKYDIFDLKGVLEEFCDQFGVRGLAYSPRLESTSLCLESAEILLGKQTMGELGQLLPALARRYDLRDAVLLAEMNLDLLLTRRNPALEFKTLPAYPSIRRDVAMLLPETVTHEAVLRVIKQAKLANLENIELFDVFRGQNVPPGRKSMAYAFIYRHPERTLTDAEVNASQEKLMAQLRQSLEAVIREA
ncbi:MAG: hypothetical protein M1608_05595 [Candidatus Omnitrophica bacterium]|nr:hypothetical protein [Candidatus Omnitrophota bacterium]